MSLGPRFYILALLTLTLATSFSLGECLPSNLDTPGNGCVPSPNICEISCPEDGTCVQTGPDQGCVDALVSNDTINHNDMTENKCLELCQASDAVGDEDKRCRFWRYEVMSNKEEVCSLMSSNQCKVPNACPPTSCSTGDVGCPNGETPGQGCPANMTFNAAAGYIHWGCIDVNADQPIPSPYDPDVDTMPGGTLCTTAQRCVDWDTETLGENTTLWRNLRVVCNSTNGNWEKDAAADGDEDAYTAVLADGSQAILEHLCVGAKQGDQAPTLVVDLASAGNGQGADLVCDIPGNIELDGTRVTITAPNHCLLLCDLHIGMTIEGQLNVDGEYKFFDQDGKAIITSEDVACWTGKMV